MSYLRFVGLCAFLIAGCAIFASANDGVDEKFVKVLSDKNFDKHVKKGTVWLVEFYAPWCGHCKNLIPVWAEAARKLASEGVETRLAKIDATASPGLTRRFSIQGYPTIKLFKDGKNRGDYPGGRTEDEIIKFARQASGNFVVNIGEGDGLYMFAGQQDISFVLAGVGSGNLPTLKAFDKIANDETVLGNIGFAIATSLTDANEYLKEEETGITLPGPSLLAINTGEVTYISSAGDAPVKLDEKNMMDFIQRNRVPFYPELAPSKNWALTKQGKKTVLAFVDPSSAATEDYTTMMKGLKRQLGNDLVFGYVDAPSNTYLLEPIGLSLGALPAFVVVDIPAMKYFKSPFLTESDEIATYLKRVVAGKETPMDIQEKGKEEKAAPAPASGNDGNGASSQAVAQIERRLEKAEAKLTENREQVLSLAAQISQMAMSINVLFAAVAVLVGALFFVSRTPSTVYEVAPSAPAQGTPTITSSKRKGK